MCLGMPGSVVEPVNLLQQSVLVDVQGRQQQVSAAMLIDETTDLPQVGDWVLVHLGFAMSRMHESEAHSVLESLDQLTAMYDDEREASDHGNA
ncbi:MAG: HypC/HybG/HupF family hydrogenase formation chaperone [Propionibacteriales bacterium]|nr:HypC/HybG/HupF family hydrogenase formation chaperone [Propionibacteriales bacterium]